MKKLILTTLVCLLLANLTYAQAGASSSTSSSGSGANSGATKFRATKNQVSEAQKKLRDSGLFSGDVSGKYSKEFRASLKKYQEANGLKKSGRLDRATTQKLNIAFTDRQLGKVKKKSGRKVFRVTKQQISSAQSKLRSSGLYSGEATGKYSREFRNSIREFQGANGLRRTGALNRLTLEKMEIALTPAQKLVPANPNNRASNRTSRKGRPVFRATKDQISTVQTMLIKKVVGGSKPPTPSFTFS